MSQMRTNDLNAQKELTCSQLLTIYAYVTHILKQDHQDHPLSKSH